MRMKGYMEAGEEIMRAAPSEEPARQYYFMEHLKPWFLKACAAEGRTLTYNIQTFGCPMVYAPQIHGKP